MALCDLLGDDQVQSRFIIDGMELDVYLPSMQLALEPGNWVLHESKVHKDERKRTRCQELGIKLITIYDDYKESDPPFDSDCYTCSCYFGSAKGKQDLKQIICEIVEDYFSENIRIALDVVQWSDIFERASRKSHKAVPFEKSIAYKAPDLIKEWHSTKNAPLTPDIVAAGSKIKRWWVCPEGHEYLMSPIDRINKGQKCHICSNRIADSRYNTISKLRPDVAQLMTDENEYDAEHITPANTTHLITLRCPRCEKTFEEFPYILFRRNTIDCPHCGKTVTD